MLPIVGILLGNFLSCATGLKSYSISRLAGNGFSGSALDGVAASCASLYQARDVWSDTHDAVYVTEGTMGKIRTVRNDGLLGTFAGGGVGSEGGAATSIKLGITRAVWGYGNTVYIGDTMYNKVFSVADGIISIFAGSGGSSFLREGLAASSTGLNYPYSLFGNTLGVLYVALGESCRVSKIVNSIITNVAGTGVNTFDSDGGQATSTAIGAAFSLCLDSVGTVYFGESFGRVRVISDSGIISTNIGTGVHSHSIDGLAATATNIAGIITGLWYNSLTSLYYSDYKAKKVKSVNANSIVSTIADAKVANPFAIYGTSLYGFYFVDDFHIFSVSSNEHLPIYDDSTEEFYRDHELLDDERKPPFGTYKTEDRLFNEKIMLVNSFYQYYLNNHPYFQSSYYYPSTGSSSTPSSYPSSACPTTEAPSLSPTTTPSFFPVVAPAVYTISAYAGKTTTSGNFGNGGPATSALLDYGSYAYVFHDSEGSVYFSDGMFRVRKISTSGIISAFLGNGDGGDSGDGGPATSASLFRAEGLWGISTGRLFVMSRGCRVRVVDQGIVSTYAGQGTSGYGGDGGQATSAIIGIANALSVDSSGNVYIMDSWIIRKINALGIISRIAGIFSPSSSLGDGGSATSCSIVYSNSLFADSIGTVYFVDTARVRKINKNQIVTAFAGTLEEGSSGDGFAATTTNFKSLLFVWSDSLGTTFLSDAENRKIRMVYTGIVYTAAGNGLTAYSNTFGSATSSGFRNQLYGLCGDTSGNLFITDFAVIRKLALMLSNSTPTVQPTSSIRQSEEPLNMSVSVIGQMPNETFKIVVPYFALSSGGSFGVPYSNVVLSSRFGNVSLLLGKSSWTSLDLSEEKVVSFTGSIGFDSSVRSVSVLKDVNGDGHDDLIIGDPYAARCYLLYGTTSGFKNMTIGFTIFGEKETDLTGWSVSDGGDVNNDTLNDIIIGAPFVNGKGAFYVIYGSEHTFDVYLNNLTSSQGYAVYGAMVSDYLGISVSSAGDVNKDGYDDVIVGAVLSASYFSGAAYVFYGGRFLKSSTTAKMTSHQGYKLYCGSYWYCGYSVSGAGDVNKDKLDDVLVGSAPQKLGLEPTAFLVFGSSIIQPNMLLTSLDPSHGIKITGGGMFVSTAGDVNADHYDDVLVYSDLLWSPSKAVILYSSVKYMMPMTSQPTILPTARPTIGSRKPTVKPSARPTMIPSISPSRIPTVQPRSSEPIVGSARPSVYPTSRPSMQTVMPSLAPSEAPTVKPTLEPSEHPSLRPTLAPTRYPTIQPSVYPSRQPSTLMPTKIDSTRHPLGVPSLSPTLLDLHSYSFNVVVGDQLLNFTHKVQDPVRYLCNATGVVAIDATSNAGVTYVITPRSDMEVIIWSFNVSIDRIDLPYFPAIFAVSDFKITAGSAIVNLPVNQLVRIMNHEPLDIVPSCFVLSKQKSDKGSKLRSLLVRVIAFCVPIIGVLILIAIMYQYIQNREKVKRMPIVPRYMMDVSTNTNGEYILKEEKEDNSSCEWDSEVFNEMCMSEFTEEEQDHPKKDPEAHNDGKDDILSPNYQPQWDCIYHAKQGNSLGPNKTTGSSRSGTKDEDVLVDEFDISLESVEAGTKSSQ